MALTLEERLASAESAYEALVAGTAVAESRDSDGSLVRYTKADLGRLERLIASLKDQIAAAAGSMPVTGPMRVRL